MKSAKLRQGKEEQTSLRGSISKSVSGGKKSQKSSGGQRKIKSVGEDVVSTPCKIPQEQGNCILDSALSSGTVSELPLDINHGDKQMPKFSPKIKLQLFPLDERIRKGLEKDGHNPFLELTLRATKKISSVLTHLCNKWGSSSIAIGELMLFPYNIVVENLTTYQRWTSIDIGICAGDVHAAVGSPELFRLRYGWVSSQPSITSRNVEATSGAENQAERKSKELKACNMNESTNLSEQRVPLEPPSQIVHMNEAAVKSEHSNLSKIRERGNDTLVEENMSAEPHKLEEPRVDKDVSQASFLWSDFTDISIGGLLSEASLQGRFSTQGMKSGGSRSQHTSFIADSLDAFIDQLKSPHVSSTLPSDMSSSILDAEDTCHSFAFSKPSSSKDFLTLGRSAFSGICSQDTASRPFKFPKSEAIAQKGASAGNALQDPKTDSLSCSAGVYNNENSLGLSSIRWNDSLGPFDLPLMSRQIIKDDTISIGGFGR